jgi:hypothetical protein
MLDCNQIVNNVSKIFQELSFTKLMTIRHTAMTGMGSKNFEGDLMNGKIPYPLNVR